MTRGEATRAAHTLARALAAAQDRELSGKIRLERALAELRAAVSAQDAAVADLQHQLDAAHDLLVRLLDAPLTD